MEVYWYRHICGFPWKLGHCLYLRARLVVECDALLVVVCCRCVDEAVHEARPVQQVVAIDATVSDVAEVQVLDMVQTTSIEHYTSDASHACEMEIRASKAVTSIASHRREVCVYYMVSERVFHQWEVLIKLLLTPVVVISTVLEALPLQSQQLGPEREHHVHCVASVGAFVHQRADVIAYVHDVQPSCSICV